MFEGVDGSSRWQGTHPVPNGGEGFEPGIPSQEGLPSRTLDLFGPGDGYHGDGSVRGGPSTVVRSV